MAPFNTIDDLEPDQRVLMRVDLNSPVEDGVVQDNRRFEKYSRTVKELAEAGHRVVLMAHQGRPGRDDFVSLDQHADILSEYVGRDVAFVADHFGEEAIEAVRSLDAGEVLLLENTRMADDELPEKAPEEHADSEFVQTLAPEFDVFINDAYSAAHRAHASLVGFAKVLPAYAGRVMEEEYEFNTSVATREFDGDVTMVVGGNKPSDVIKVMNNLGDRVDNYLIGGVGGELFLRAQGYPVGFDLPDTDFFDEPWAEHEDTIRSLLEERGDQIYLPVDMAYAGEDGERAEIAVEDIEEKDAAYLDVGQETIEAFEPIVRDSAAALTKGALGVFEDERFSYGTREIIRIIGETDCFSVIGGGDTSRAVEMYGLDADDYDHLSIAGGAYLRALTGEELIGVEVLKEAAE
jgi:phosphoglycerate kinase